MSVGSELADAGVGVVAGLEEEYSAEHLLIELSLLTTMVGPTGYGLIV